MQQSMGKLGNNLLAKHEMSISPLFFSSLSENNFPRLRCVLKYKWCLMNMSPTLFFFALQFRDLVVWGVISLGETCPVLIMPSYWLVIRYIDRSSSTGKKRAKAIILRVHPSIALATSGEEVEKNVINIFLQVMFLVYSLVSSLGHAKT